MKLSLRNGALLLLSLGLAGNAIGASAPGVPDSLRACARKQDVLQRLSCYDAEMAKLDAPQAGAPAAPVAASAGAAATAAAPVARAAAPTPPAFGEEQLHKGSTAPMGEEQLRKPAATGSSRSLLKFWKSDDKAEEPGMTARIEAVSKNGYGFAILTLDNGQVWRQQEKEDYFPLAAGDTIRIEKGALGSYRLKPIREGWSRYMRVSRTK